MNLGLLPNLTLSTLALALATTSPANPAPANASPATQALAAQALASPRDQDIFDPATLPQPKWRLSIEAGATIPFRNQVQVPGDAGTRFDFTQLTAKRPALTGRYELVYEGQTGPGFRLLVAPYFASRNGTIQQDTTFKNTTFTTGTIVAGTYRFDSYRISYRNRWKQGPNSDWRFGATLKLRDAEIRMATPTISESERNTGLVPLLHLFGEERLSPNTTLFVDIDALAAPQGRAIDFGIGLSYRIDNRQALTIAFRTLEGGADNDTVYNFAWTGTLSFGYQVRF